MGVPVKTQLVNGLGKLFDLRGHNIDMSDQVIFVLTDMVLHDK